MGTNFFTNEKENTLLEKIEGVFKYKKVHFFDALVGYFRASGYFRIRKFITQTPNKACCSIPTKSKHRKNSSTK